MIKRFKPTAGLIIIVLISVCLLITGILMYRAELSMKTGGSDIAVRIPEQEKLTHVDSLPHYLYKEIADSLKHLTDAEKGKNTLIPSFFPSSIGFFGFLQTSRTWYDWYTEHKSYLVFDYYIWLTDYSLDEGLEFYYKDGKNYLRQPNGSSKEIKVAYLADFHKSVLVPVSKDFFTGGRIIIFILMGVIGLALLYIFIALPFNVLLNISRGKVFTLINLRDLHLIAFTALGFFLTQMIMPYIISLFFLKKIPAELTISFSTLLGSNLEMGLFGIVTLAIARAFAKGYKLQQDQDLTI